MKKLMVFLREEEKNKKEKDGIFIQRNNKIVFVFSLLVK